MIRLAVSVEGQTEEAFVKSVLAPHLRPSGVEPTPILLGKARGSGVGGGNVSIERLTGDMSTLYHSFDVVTSLVDFYGFHGKGGRTIDELEQELNRQIQASVSGRWDQRKVIPYVQRHEFEGLLFSNVNAFAAAMLDTLEQDIERLAAIRSRFQTPEDINDNQDTAPSKRIVSVIPRYRKLLEGPEVAKVIGLPVIRGECPRFSNWLTKLEHLGSGGGSGG